MHTRIVHTAELKGSFRLCLFKQLFKLQLSNCESPSASLYDSNLLKIRKTIQDYNLILEDEKSSATKIKTATVFLALEKLNEEEMQKKHVDFTKFFLAFIANDSSKENNKDFPSEVPNRIHYRIHDQFVSIALTFGISKTQQRTLIYNFL